MTRRAVLKLALGLPLALAVAGCGVVAGTRSMLGLDPKPVTPDWKSLTLSTADDANANSAVAVDVVLVKDTAVLESLMAMPAAKWFASRADLRRGFPEALTVFSYELTPAQTVRVPPEQWSGQRAWAALVFAHYLSPGEHRARLMLNTPGYVVRLNAQGMSVNDLKSGTAQ
ncbi:hypothetical protein [Duganella aceris]|uniref:Type VI secretion protein n=1 Tax=Duganella aceris TaxID=2703883 RepID=A0ABX0FN54_9BURK|nr:hypothetical protein [Duganella aceris]NGZ86034.1 hypothetical protein [Duganella aceris]